MDVKNTKEINYFLNGLKIIFFKCLKVIQKGITFCRLKNILCFAPYFLAILFTVPVLLFEGIRVLGGLPEEKQTGPTGYIFRSVFGDSREEKTIIVAIAIIQSLVIAFASCISFVCIIINLYEYFKS